MSAISTYLEYIRSKIYAKDVRTAIVNAISQCYDDVNAPALQTEAMQAAVQAKIDAGQMAAYTVADGSFAGSKLANGAVTTAKIADGAVTTAKIADGAVTGAKVGTGALTGDNIANKAIGTTKIDDSAVTWQKLAPQAVHTTEIADGAVTSAKLGNAAVTTVKIANKAITKEKLADDVVPDVDPTLSVSGMPADAKVVGDNFDNIIKIINNANLVSNATITQNKGYGINADIVGTLNNYSVVQFNVIGGISIHIMGLNENLTSYGYCIKNENGVTIQSGSESDDMTIKVPADGHVMVITIKTSNLSSLMIIPYLGESYTAIKEVGSKITAFFPQDATVGYYLLSNGNFSQRSGNYAYSDYIPVIPNAKYMIVGRISASTSTICHCFYDKNKNFISSTLANAKYITTPSGCEYVRLSLSSNNINIFDIEFLEKKRNVVVFGDSWSDNDPEHTQYTKWTTLLSNSGDYAVKVYAQNGSTITGDTPSYGMNGNVQGQIEQFTSDELPAVDIVIFFGGINDFRGGKTVDDVVTKLTSFVNTVKSMYPDVNIVYIANHQLFITKEQLDYMHSIVDASRSIGVRSFTTFGWIPPTNFISDMVHPDDVGYKYIFANVESILCGGDLHYVRNYALIDPTSESDGVGGHIVESWDNGYPSFSSDLVLYSDGVNKTFEWSITTSQKMLLSSLPFSKIYNKLNNVNANGACVIENTTPTSFTGNHKMNSNSLFRLITDASGRTGQWYTNDYN